jgi:uncharacterized protein (DUF433 family)
MARNEPANEDALLARITTDAAIFGGKPPIRGHRLAVEHVLDMLAAGAAPDTLKGYAWLEADDIRTCLVYMPGGCSGTSVVSPPSRNADA